MLLLEKKVQGIREKMSQFAEQAGRNSSDIKLVAVTKTHPAAVLQEVAPLVDAVGENRVQEALSKKEACTSCKVEWRLIGHLQKNKVRKAIDVFDTIDSLDSSELAVVINRVAEEKQKIIPVLIEVNTAQESKKTGADPSDFPHLLENVLSLPNLSLQGLMTVGPLSSDEYLVRKSFASLRALKDKAEIIAGKNFPVLSMGMSNDFGWGILEGSTMIRLGSALFGSR